MGTATRLDAGEVRWLSPLPLWSGILAGPIAWALDLGASYALVKWACHTSNHALLFAIAVAALAIVCGGAMVSWSALQRTAADVPSDGGRPRQRARFMAVLGLGLCALFAPQILAGAIPPSVLDACS